MERIDDVMEYQDDFIFSDDEGQLSQRKLSGNVEVTSTDIYFGFYVGK